MWAPRKMDLARLREVKGLEDLHNRACPDVPRRTAQREHDLRDAYGPVP